MSEDKYYITGGAGFIGRHFNNLVNSDQVINIDLRSQQVVPNQVKSDIKDIDNIRDSIGDSNIILHLAASHYDFEKDYYETNVFATEKLLKVATEKNIERFIFFSSVAVYGDAVTSVDETSIPAPINDYGKSKLKAEELVKNWALEDSKRKVVIIRPAVIFGPYNFGNLFNLTRNIDRGLNFQIGGSPVIKSVAYVENLVEATLYLVNNLKDPIKIVNYVDEPQLTNSEIAGEISKAMGRKGTFKLPYRVALSLGYIFDLVGKILGKELMISVRRVKKFCTPTHFSAKKIRQEGFEPRFTTEEALELTTQWYLDNKVTWEKEYDLLKKLFKSNYGITIE